MQSSSSPLKYAPLTFREVQIKNVGSIYTHQFGENLHNLLLIGMWGKEYSPVAYDSKLIVKRFSSFC